MRNDIYLHADKKAKDFPEKDIRRAVSRATLELIGRMPVNWGGYSQIRAEMALLEAAARTPHAYYHLLSGVDFPLKTQDEIRAFFAENAGRNYIKYDWNTMRSGKHLERVREYRFFQDAIGRNPGRRAVLLQRLEGKSLRLQKHFSVNRIRGQESIFFKGTNWFSITHEMALYVLSQREFIKKHFRGTICADEMFLHTVAKRSPLADTIVDDSLRLIDWDRGSPYIFRLEDYGLLTGSEQLFARKFDEKIDMEIVRRLAERLEQSGD